MMLPVVAVVAVVGAYVIYARTTPHGRILQVLDASLPEPLRSMVAYSVTEGADAKSLAELSKKLQSHGAPVAAAVVAARATQVAKPSPVSLVKKPAPPTFERVPSPVANVQLVYDDEAEQRAARRREEF